MESNKNPGFQAHLAATCHHTKETANLEDSYIFLWCVLLYIISDVAATALTVRSEFLLLSLLDLFIGVYSGAANNVGSYSNFAAC